MNKLVDSMFFRLGAIKFSESFPNLTELTNICTYDATLYSSNQPKKCMIRQEETTFRPHLIRHLNLLDYDMPEMRTYIQQMWDDSNQYIDSLGVEVYQTFFIITKDASVKRHSHGDHMGDTVTVFSTLGTSPSNSYLYLGRDCKLTYPDPGEGNYAVCFDCNTIHYTESFDSNYYFHFVYDLTDTVVNIEKNVMKKIT